MWRTWTGPSGGRGLFLRVVTPIWSIGRTPQRGYSAVTSGRTSGPLFLTTDRSRNPTSRRDLHTPTGQARLAYRTAAALFGRHSEGWTLHQLRHSSLTHLAEGGASAVILQAKSRHRDIRTLSVYTRPGPEAVAHLTDNQFDGR